MFDDGSSSDTESDEELDMYRIPKKKKNKFLKDIEKARSRKNRAYSKATAGDYIATMLNNAKNTGDYQDNVVTLLRQNLGPIYATSRYGYKMIIMLGMIVIFQPVGKCK